VEAAVPLDVEAIRRACERHGVERLRVFGSVLTDHFDPVIKASVFGSAQDLYAA